MAKPQRKLADKIDWIAETEVVWVYRDRTRRACRLAVARPVLRPTGEWACQTEGLPMSRRGLAVFGATSWQALLLAMQFVGYDVHHHISVGGKIMWPQEPGRKRATACSPELLLGALFREPKEV